MGSSMRGVRSLKSLVAEKPIWSYVDAVKGETIQVRVETDDGLMSIMAKLETDIKAKELLELVEVVEDSMTDLFTRKQSTQSYLVLRSFNQFVI